MQPDSPVGRQRARILALVRTRSLIDLVGRYLGHTDFTVCADSGMSHAIVAESPPKIIIFETGIWTPAESSSLVALLSSLSDIAVFVFWRPGATALAELWEIARVANNVHPIHEN